MSDEFDQQAKIAALRAMRMKEEWGRNHAIGFPASQCFPCALLGEMDPRHKWADEQWLQQAVNKELKG